MSDSQQKMSDPHKMPATSGGSFFIRREVFSFVLNRVLNFVSLTTGVSP